MASQSGCPDAALLEALARGRLPEDEAAPVREHVEGCPRCAEAVSTLRGTATEQTAAIEAPPHAASPVSLTASRTGSLSTDVPTAHLPESRVQAAEPSVADESVAMEQRSTLTSPLPSIPDQKTSDKTFEVSLPPLPEGDEPKPGEETYEFLLPPQAADEIGRLGPFRVLKVLGSGGMGVVFQAEDPTLQRPVALKAMRPSIAISKRARQRFLREARATAALTHDHIVRIHTVGEDHSILYLAMQLLRGETLRERVRREAILPVPEILRIGREIADGLAAAHEHGLIHRDIKPGNIWLEAGKGRVKILDFGLAHVDDDGKISHSGMVAGTPQYMAPEQAEGLTVDARADLFSLGCVLYRMATGKVPFQGPNLMAILRSLALEEAPDPRKLNPEVPAELAQLILRLLAKTPDQRPASAREVQKTIAELERKLAQAESGTPGAQAPAPPARSRRRWALAAACLLIAGAIAVVLYLRRDVAPEPATLEFTSADDHVIVHVQGASQSYTLSDWKKDARLEIPAGDYQIRLLYATPDLESEMTRVSLEPGQHQRVAIRRQGKPLLPAAEALREIAIPRSRLAWAGEGDPQRAPAPLVAVLGPGPSAEASQVWRNPGKARRFVFSPDGKQAVVAMGSRVGLLILDSNKLSTFSWSRFEPGEATPRPADDVAFVGRTPAGTMLSFAFSQSDVRVLDFRNNRTVQVLKGHTGSILSAVLSPDGKQLATASKDQTAKVWDLANGRMLWNLTGHADAVTDVAFSEDGTRLATASADKTVRLWDLTAGREQRTLEHGGAVTSTAFSRDGQSLVTGARDMTVRVWEAKTGKLIKERKVPLGSGLSVRFSPDGQRIVSVGWQLTPLKRYEGGIVEVWDWHNDRTLVLAGTQRDGHNFAAFTPDSKRLLISSEDALTLWELPPPGQLLAVDGHQGPVHTVAIRPDGTLLASGGQDTFVRLWDLGGAQLRRSLPGHRQPIGQVAFSPDGLLLASADPASIRLWDVETNKAVHVLQAEGTGAAISSIAFSRDGRRLAAGCADGVRIYDVAARTLTQTLTGHKGAVQAVVFGRGAILAAAAADGIRLWNADDGTLIHHLKADDQAVSVLAFRRDGEVLAAAGADQTIRLWEVAGGKLQASLRASGGPLYALTFRMDGRVLAAAGADGAVRLWDLRANPPEDALVRCFSIDPKVAPERRLIRGLAFTPDGNFLATANPDGTLYVLRLTAPSGASLVQRPASGSLPLLFGEARALQERWARFLKRFESEPNSLGMKLMLIPPGEFDLRPDSRAYINRPYYLGAHEVTLGQFQEFVKDTGYKTEAEANGKGGLEWGAGQAHPDNTWKTLLKTRGPDHPVAHVSWNDAQRFCEWLSQKEKKSYRLPREEEWEWACRAGATAAYHFGSHPERLAEYAWFASNSDHHAHAVGGLKPNVWGLYDIYGNVREFCDGTFIDSSGPKPIKKVVLRGGGFADGTTVATQRFFCTPDLAASVFGFRVAYNLDGPHIVHVVERLTDDDPFDVVRTGSRCKVHNVRLLAGVTYTMDLKSDEFDAYLRVEDENGVPLAEDDDSGEGFNARLLLAPKQSGTYRIIATCYGARPSHPVTIGRYTLTVRDSALGEPEKGR